MRNTCPYAYQPRPGAEGGGKTSAGKGLNPGQLAITNPPSHRRRGRSCHLEKGAFQRGGPAPMSLLYISSVRVCGCARARVCARMRVCARVVHARARQRTSGEFIQSRARSDLGDERMIAHPRGFLKWSWVHDHLGTPERLWETGSHIDAYPRRMNHWLGL